uniref:ARM repeat superfamily protein n=1 Tax=Kalanchoe fedtschenkoi TaxID=63787 RepID=A0A7N0TVK3_KALFE
MHNSITTTLNHITRLLSLLLLSSLAVKSFLGRWHILRTKISQLHNALALISSSPHFSQNQLLSSLLPNLLSCLQRLNALSQQCLDHTFNGGKLLMQSDLDMCSSSLSDLLHHLDLLIKSGVLHHSTALVLSHPGPNSHKDDLAFFLRDLFTRLQIGGPDFKKQALHSLVLLLQNDPKAAAVVATEGDLAYLIQLLDFTNTNHQDVVRELAALAISLLCAAGDSPRKIVFEEGGLGPLLRLIDTGSVVLRERAAMAVEMITSDPENAWAISAYGGVSILISSCESGHQSIQIPAVGAIRNISVIEDVRVSLAEEGAVPLLVSLISSGNHQIVSRAVDTIAVLSSSDRHLRDLVIRENCLQRLVQMVLKSSTPTCTLEHSLRAVLSLSSYDPVSRTLTSSTPFVMRLGELIKLGGTCSIQHSSASLIGSLLISESSKRAIGSCIGALVKLMESPKPVGLQEAAGKALVSLLSVRSNRRDLIEDDKSVTRLVKLLDPRNEAVAKEFPVMVACALRAGGGNVCRKRLVDAGAYVHLQSLAGMDVAGAKKAVQKFAGAGSKLKSIFSRTWRDY